VDTDELSARIRANALIFRNAMSTTCTSHFSKRQLALAR
jgi:hypothetical protein